MAGTRDAWEKFDIVAKAFAAIGLPVIVGLLGYWHNEAEREASRGELAQRDSLAREERRADRMTALLDHLSSDNPRQRLMALRVAEQLGAQRQLPSDLVPVLRELATEGATPAERAAAGSAVRSAHGPLFERLFARDAGERVAASGAIVTDARRDSTVVPALLGFASTRLDDANGTFNTLGVLTQVCPAATRAYAAEVAAYVRAARASAVAGPSIRALADQLERCR